MNHAGSPVASTSGSWGSRFDRWMHDKGARVDVPFYVYTAATLLAFVLMDRAMERFGKMPLVLYGQPWLVGAQMERLGWMPLLVLVLGCLWLARRGHLLAGWADWGGGRELRLFVVGLGALMVWPFATYGFNHFFDQGHYASRLMLIVLLGLSWWRPVFIFPLLALLYTVMGQLSVYALGGSILAHKLQVLHVLNLFAAAWFVRSLTGHRRVDVFWFLSLCLVAGAYWVAFLAKMQIDWFGYGKTFHALPAAYAHGWLGFLDAERIVAFVDLIRPFDGVMQFAVLLFEGGCLLIFSHRRVAAALLAALVVFHTGVFLLFGFLFWTWMALDAALLALVVSGRMRMPVDVFSRRNLFVSLLLISSAAWWARPPVLGWFDTRVNYTYKIDAHMADGTRVRLAPQFFAPYEDVFTMASFGYLVADHPLLVGPYGVSADRRVAEALREPTDAAGLLRIERELGAARFDAARSADFANFIKRFVANRNGSGPMGATWYALAPPRQFWSFDGSLPDAAVPIHAITVVEQTTYFDDHRIAVVREQEVAHFRIDSQVLAPGR